MNRWISVRASKTVVIRVMSVRAMSMHHIGAIIDALKESNYSYIYPTINYAVNPIDSVAFSSLSWPVKKKFMESCVSAWKREIELKFKEEPDIVY
jgi:hypothetical protein